MTRRRSRDQRGLAAIMISMSMVALLIIAGMVLDFGMIRYDRQINKGVADAAVAAGMRAFDKDDGQVYAYQGVCDALSFLKTNEPALSGLPAYAPCSSTVTLAKTCTSADTTSHAAYSATTSDGRYSVVVKAPYTLPDPGWPEDAMSGLQTDVADKCLQLAVMITERQKPGLGSLVTKEKIASTIRSVGRVQAGPGIRSPALLLLDRHDCQVLTTGTNTNSANQDNFIRVYGAGVAPVIQPGTIHADSDGSACGQNETIFQGKRLDGIVAYAAPDHSEHGIISSYAARLGVAPGIVSDGSTRVYGSDGVNETEAATMTKYPVSPLGLITRSIVDNRYLAALHVGVASARAVFTAYDTAAKASAAGWAVLDSCSGNNQAAINALSASRNIFVDCTNYRGEGTFMQAEVVLFKGTIDQQAKTLMPKATEVYVRGSSSTAITSTGNPFRVHYEAAGTGLCPGTPQAESARLFILSGAIANNNGHFQACNTVVIMMSGFNDACLPPVGTVVPPTTRPCGTAPGSAGNGYLNLAGGGSGATQIDWTAPNKYDFDMSLLTAAQKQAAWNNFEDLAFWSEAWGDNNFKMSGGAGLHLIGVFMTPNADPFTVTGGGAQMLTNAQYIATKFQVDGGASLKMVVDPNNTVTLPKLTYFDLVR